MPDFVRIVRCIEVGLVEPMATIIESAAAFAQRCNELTPDGSLLRDVAAQQIVTFRALAFAIGTPQSPPADVAFDRLSQAVFGAAVSIGQSSMLRHLHFEATTYVVSTYKEMISQDPADGTAVKRIPLLEKRARKESQRTRLVGLDITGELEPSHQLLDLINHQYKTGVLVWVPPSRCSKRESEILTGFKDKQHTLKVEESVINQVGSCSSPC